MNWMLVGLDAAAVQPWKNGGGTTRELLAWPAPHDWQVRVSVADVSQPGPFSRFPGLERWFAVLEGAGVVLRIGGAVQTVLRGSEPLRFDGAAQVDCAPVDGATRDFNLMAAPGRGHVSRLDGGRTFRTRAGLLALYAHERPARIELDRGVRDVPPYHLAWCVRTEAASATAHGDGALLVEALA